MTGRILRCSKPFITEQLANLTQNIVQIRKQVKELSNAFYAWDVWESIIKSTYEDAFLGRSDSAESAESAEAVSYVLDYF